MVEIKDKEKGGPRGCFPPHVVDERIECDHCQKEVPIVLWIDEEGWACENCCSKNDGGIE